MCLPLRGFLLASALVAASATATPAQEVLYSFDGTRIGYSVSGAGDVNGDGFADVITGNGDSVARVYSGADGALLYSWSGVYTSIYSLRVSGAGDMNADGFDDLIVGAPGDDFLGTDSGAAYVYSGADGSLLYLFHGGPGDGFGISVSDVGDLNLDGYDDVIVGAQYDDDLGTNSGSAQVFSGFDGSVLLRLDGDSDYDLFGWAAEGAGDVNLDGWPDVIVGATGNAFGGVRGGSVWVYSGRDGALLHAFHGTIASEYYGYAVAGAGDVNGDGFQDVAAGRSGLVDVYSGKDGALLHHFEGGRSFGTEVNGAGDVDGDGFADLIVGEYENDVNAYRSGKAWVYSGADGSVLYFYEGLGREYVLGISVDGAGDVNRDGFADLIVGAFRTPTAAGTGRAWVFSGGPPPPLQLYAPRLHHSIGTTFWVTRATPGARVFFAGSLSGLGSTSLPAYGVELSLDAAKRVDSALADALGSVAWSRSIPAVLAGKDVWLQAFENGRVSNWLNRAVH